MDLLLKEKVKELGGFGEDVLRGLSQSPKALSPKYLYDTKGSRLFEEIMHLPEYYPTRCELEILNNYKKQLLEFCSEEQPLELIDLGAGNGMKSMILINYFMRRVKLKYVPVDISQAALEEFEQTLKKKYPLLEVEGLTAEYAQGLERLKGRETQKLVLFLGSNVGNFTLKETIVFLKKVRASLNKDDLLLIGFDLKKDPARIRMAYNDSRGITARFNFNILTRINTELGGQFDVSKFSFYPTYDPDNGEVKSYLVSNEKQEVYVKRLDKSFLFEKWETIHTECSYKFDLPLIHKLAEKTGFRVEANFFDSKEYFADSLWRA